jgi:hypothetical protein
VRRPRIAAGVEAASLVVLLDNLHDTHTKALTTLVGPLHGTAYLVVIAAIALAPTATSPGARWRAAVDRPNAPAGRTQMPEPVHATR